MRGVTLAVALMVVIAPSAWAQTSDTDAIERETAAASARAGAAGQALDYQAAEDGEPVTYADVLRDPDNIELNFCFARQQVRRGDVGGSAATLERILLVNPDLAQVRLFYAVVLFRLDNIDEAEREFKTVAALDIPAAVRAEARSLAAECRTLDGGLGGLYDLYDERIEAFLADPPGPDWDGVFVATTK